MSTQNVLILGAGAAGTAAARILGSSDAVTVTLIGRTDETPYNRTLVNKGIAIGLLTPEQAALPGVAAIADTAVEVDPDTRTVRLESGRVEHYDALLITTGSAPRDLGAGVTAAAVPGTGRVTALHSLRDAVAVRDLLAGLGRPGRIVISGAGLVAGETATLLHDRGHEVTLLARAATPGISVFGTEVAETLAATHQANLHTAFGRTITSLTETEDSVQLTLDDGTVLPADVLIVAHGTTPTAPAPWGSGVAVDGESRTATPGVYAAGGVAIHNDPTLGTWRIDHWADAAAQGEHAARTLLADLGVGEQPGTYQPRAPFTATIHGAMIAGAGLTGHHGNARAESTDPLVILHQQGNIPVGVLGLDAAPAVFGWMPHLYTPVHTDDDTLAAVGAAGADSK
ncbi:FAD/NAD(P)-binding oxidoreductase [Georgenia sp. M64]|uniref:FAD/NAD(P)-binding oxidoreductase n=1 Tax=Georgenia sp. M64 TaxID=3120520 RepID=UPI0030E3D966